MKLEGKVAIVTGGAQGIGKAIAIALAREGANVVISDLNLKGAKGVAKEIEGMGRRALALKADVSKPRDINRVVESTVKEFKRIDILINNAGILDVKPVEEITEKDWDRTMAVNLKSTFLCSQAVMPYMKKQRSGKIVNLASLAGRIGGVAAPIHYSASKAGVICLTKSLAKHLAPYKVNVNAIAPGPINTEMFRLFSEADQKRLLKQIPLGRYGQPEDIAEAVVYLVSDSGSYLTGQTLDINGGLYMS